jgi:hypothetical protein
MKDISAGDELTFDYGMLFKGHAMSSGERLGWCVCVCVCVIVCVREVEIESESSDEGQQNRDRQIDRWSM